MGKKRTTSKMDVDDAAPTQQKEEEAKGGDADGAEDMTTQGLTGKEKKKAEWLTRQQLKQKVGAIKKERCGPSSSLQTLIAKGGCVAAVPSHSRRVQLAGTAGSEGFGDGAGIRQQCSGCCC